VRDITERVKDKLLLDTQRTLASTLNATSDLEYAMIVSLSTALKVTGMDSGFIYFVSEDKDLELIFRDGLPEDLCRHIADLEFDAIGERLVYKGTPVYLKQDDIANKIAPSWKKEGLKSLAILPIHHEGKLFCCLNVASHELERFTEFSRNALEAIAVEVGGTVSRLMAEKALRESEERFRNIVESSPMGMFMMQLDPDGRLTVTGSNRTADKILNIDTSMYVGMPVEGAFPSLMGTEALEKCRDVAVRGGTWHIERLDYRDEKVKGAFEIYAFQSSPKTIAVMFLEISEKIRVEEELKKYWNSLEELIKERTKQLEDAQEELIRKERLAALGRLTASVSHEIRNPLGTVRTSVFSIGDALERNEMERVDRALKLAERNIVRCDAIIADLLDYTRARDLFLKLTDIDQWLKELLEEQPIPKGIEYEWRLNSNVEVPIDREQFRRAVINVINNAVQAFDNEDYDIKKITVTTGVFKKRLEIEIVDTGCGIPEPIFDKIFEPLFSGKSFGVGMGLPIVKNIMTQHGGDIEIKSDTGEDGQKGGGGTTVMLWLPLKEKGEDKGKG
jgi:signal transduction histidine kinase